MRRFHLLRTVDTLGVSGTGVVAEGIQFTDGTVVIRWRTVRASTVQWASIDDAVAVHCAPQGGTTKIHWLDEPLAP